MNEEEKKAVKNLREYIEKDFAYRKPNEKYSDFDKFCYNHCKDIDILLRLIEKLQKENKILGDNYIPIQKVKKEIEKLKQEIEDLPAEACPIMEDDLQIKIGVLEELLESEE